MDARIEIFWQAVAVAMAMIVGSLILGCLLFIRVEQNLYKAKFTLFASSQFAYFMLMFASIFLMNAGGVAGSALDGSNEGGHYILVAKGRQTEVTQAYWEWTLLGEYLSRILMFVIVLTIAGIIAHAKFREYGRYLISRTLAPRGPHPYLNNMQALPFEDQFRNWLRASLSDGPPADVVGFAFNLYEPGDDPDSKFGVELVGADEFKLHDSDWPCEEIWEPNTRGLHIPRNYSGDDWEGCLAKLRELLKEVLAGDSVAAQTLRSVEGVGLGFVDGDLEIVWHRPAGE
ncbi:hypothetical protein [Blastopirellula marina]|uniref:Uncharacterized protein n=1 Tax=Blastopirellula marina TaxID=124 RepID=A0A2S8G978_9BACT|nr:hypothetical protein [Blastopirellula marina]PQO40983.1 hypothetical protein C5Y98_05235 [Blastopirellula marina]PTL45866.1 hypothetical protein C5Y97_05235 [Blastopirellula marina]